MEHRGNKKKVIRKRKGNKQLRRLTYVQLGDQELATARNA
jgi:hypothetical protein